MTKRTIWYSTRPLAVLLIWLLACGLPSCAATATTKNAAPTGPLSAYAAPGPYKALTLAADWRDAARDCSVPVKVYYPAQAPAPWPVIVFSHGLGGSREGYRWLGEQWAGHGYCVVLPTHTGSDSSLLSAERPMQAMRAAMTNPSNLVNRPLDVSFVIDELTRLNKAPDGPLSGKLDLARIGIGGHSFGGYTTLAIAGEQFKLPIGGKHNLGDPRVKAALAMSPPARPGEAAALDAQYGAIKIPTMVMTGTEDKMPLPDDDPANRRIPFDHMSGIEHYLFTLIGGNHMIFSGIGTGEHKALGAANDQTTTARQGGRRSKLLMRMRERRRNSEGQGEQQAAMREAILGTSTAFWDACLKGDAQARAWLQTSSKADLAGVAQFEARGK